MVNQIIELLRNYVIMALIAGLIAGYIASALSGKNSIGIIAGILIMLTVLMVPYMSDVTCEYCGVTKPYREEYCSVCSNGHNSGYCELVEYKGKIVCSHHDINIQ